MIYPRVRIPASHVEACRKWALEHIKPESRSDLSRSVSISPESAYDFEVQFEGKLREIAMCLYFGLQPSKTLNLVHGRGDFFDVAVGPILIDVKGSSHPAAELMPYSVGRTNAGLYEKSQFTHLAMVRDLAANEFELCGWMTKEEFYERHLVAPDGHPKAASWIPGTWYVPIEWLQLIEQLRSYRGPYLDHAGRLIHYCQHPLCGRKGMIGARVSPLHGRLGAWYCFEHSHLGRSVSSTPPGAAG